MLVGTIYSSARIITKASPDAKVLIEIVEKYKPTTVLTVPYLMAELLNTENLKPFKCIRNFISSGAILTKKLADDFRGVIPNGQLLNAFGSTENSCAVAIAVNQSESIGQLAHNLEMKVGSSKSWEYRENN